MNNYGFNFNTTYLDLPEEFYKVQNPSDVPIPKNIIINDKLATSLGLDLSKLDQNKILIGTNSGLKTFDFVIDSLNNFDTSLNFFSKETQKESPG